MPFSRDNIDEQLATITLDSKVCETLTVLSIIERRVNFLIKIMIMLGRYNHLHIG